MNTASADPIRGLDEPRELLSRLGWGHAAARLAELMEQAVGQHQSLAAFLTSLARAEQEQREEKRLRDGLHRSGLPTGKTLASFDFVFARGLEKGRVDLLATSEFVARQETVLILGPPGVGKTHLAAGLGVQAITHGFSVWFVGAAELIDLLRRDEQAPSVRIRQRRYMTCKLLILDELGFQALDRPDAHRLFRLINHRYERSSTIITSNKSIREWPALLAGDEALAAAILDRLLHHCHVLSIDGASYRLRHLEAAANSNQGPDPAASARGQPAPLRLAALACAAPSAPGREEGGARI